MLPNQEIQVELAALRQKINANMHTPDDMRKAIELMRKARGQSGESAAAAKSSKTKAKSIDSQALLDEL